MSLSLWCSKVLTLTTKEVEHTLSDSLNPKRAPPRNVAGFSQRDRTLKLFPGSSVYLCQHRVQWVDTQNAEIQNMAGGKGCILYNA